VEIFENCSNSTALKLRIDVEIMTPAEQNTQDGAPVSTRESGDSHIGGHQEAFAAPVSSGHTKSSCTGTEADPQAPSPILITEIEKVLSLIASNYLLTTPPRCKADHDDFLAYMEKMRLVITGVGIGSLLITVKCTSLEILKTLWEDYSSGHLGEVVQRCFVTEEILTELSLAELKLQTTISEEEYIVCKMHFEKDPAQGNSFFSKYSSRVAFCDILIKKQTMGSMVASWLVHSTPEQALQVEALIGNVVLCS